AEARARRKAKRAARKARRHGEPHPTGDYAPESPGGEFWDWAPDGAEGRQMKKLLDLIMDAIAARRTSTKGGVMGVAAIYAIDWVQQMAPGLLGDKAEDYALLAVVWLVSRISKTPANPGVL